MNLPNKLTVTRVVLIPVVAALMLYAPAGGWLFWLLAGLVYGAAAITDAFDGSIARKRGLITDFGKLMDPVADKLLVAAVFICLVELGLCSSWVLIIILAREFLVTSVRSVASSRGLVIAANKWGKAKTIFQMTAIVVVFVLELAKSLLGGMPFGELFCTISNLTEQIMLWLSAAITLISGAVYVYQSRELFLDA